MKNLNFKKNGGNHAKHQDIEKWYQRHEDEHICIITHHISRGMRLRWWRGSEKGQNLGNLGVKSDIKV